MAGRALVILYVGFIFVAEKAQCAQDGVWRRLPEPAQARIPDKTTELFQRRQVSLGRAAIADTLKQARQLNGPSPTRHTFATALVGAKCHKKLGQIDHAGPIVNDNEAARANDLRTVASVISVSSETTRQIFWPLSPFREEPGDPRPDLQKSHGDRTLPDQIWK